MRKGGQRKWWDFPIWWCLRCTCCFCWIFFLIWFSASKPHLCLRRFKVGKVSTQHQICCPLWFLMDETAAQTSLNCFTMEIWLRDFSTCGPLTNLKLDKDVTESTIMCPVFKLRGPRSHSLLILKWTFLTKFAGFPESWDILRLGKVLFRTVPVITLWLFLASMSLFTPSPLMFWVLWISCSDPLEDFDCNFRPSLQLSMELRLWHLMWPTTNRQKNGRHWSCGWRKVCRMVVEIYWGAAVVVKMWWFDDQFVVFGVNLLQRSCRFCQLRSRDVSAYTINYSLVVIHFFELLRSRIPLESWGFLQISLTNIRQWSNAIGWWSNICKMLTWKVPAVLVATKEGPKLKDVFQE